jgi:subtilase family serine protease
MVGSAGETTLLVETPVASGGGLSEFFARPQYQDGVEAVMGAKAAR